MQHILFAMKLSFFFENQYFFTHSNGYWITDILNNTYYTKIAICRKQNCMDSFNNVWMTRFLFTLFNSISLELLEKLAIYKKWNFTKIPMNPMQYENMCNLTWQFAPKSPDSVCLTRKYICIVKFTFLARNITIFHLYGWCLPWTNRAIWTRCPSWDILHIPETLKRLVILVVVVLVLLLKLLLFYRPHFPFERRGQWK